MSRRRTRVGIGTWLTAVAVTLASPVRVQAQDAEATAPADAVDAQAGGAAAASAAPEPEGLRLEWSGTAMVQGKVIADREANDGVGGFFDQYEYTPNKGSAFPAELGVRDASLDLFDEADSPIFQLRLESPTSNLGVSGSDVDQPFFNQRVQTSTRGAPFEDDARWALDLDYARMRTEQLRVFPDTGGAGLVFEDQTNEDDRFFRDRTGFVGELRRRAVPERAGEAKGDAKADAKADATPGATADGAHGLAHELAVRGGFQARRGLGQRRAHRDPVNDWLGLDQGLDRNVSEVGGGVLLGSARSGGLQLTLDYDYEQLRWKSPELYEAGLGAPPPAADRPIGYVPDSNRSTGRVGLRGRLGSRLGWTAAYRVSLLDQAGDGTRQQAAAGLDENRILTQSVAGTLRWQAARSLSLRAEVDFDLRDNRIERDTTLFNPTGGSQVDPFIDDWRRVMALLEAEWRFLRHNSVELGVRYDDVSRSLDFAEAGGPRILPENALVADRSQMIDVYAGTRLRLWRRLRVRGEIGYRAAPETGYITELEDLIHGRLDLRYTLPTSRPVAFTAFARGDTGHNDDFEMVAGLGPDPAGPGLGRRFDRWTVQWGVGVEVSPTERLSVFASFVRGCVSQESGVVTSSWQRYFQENGTPANALAFTDLGIDDVQQKSASLIFGLHRDWWSSVDSGVSYTYTRATADYEGDSDPALDLLRTRRRIENQTHLVDFEAGWRPTEGMRLLAGYRLQLNRDDVDPPQSTASAATPIDRSTHQHTITLGITLDGRFFERGS